VASVVIPCWNAAATVRATIASALAQEETVEVVAVDDGSTDDTAAVLRAIAAGDSRVRVVTQANAGVSAARNTGIAEACCGFVAFLDSDDLWQPGHLTRNLAHLAHVPDLGVSFSRARFVDEAGRVIGVARPKLAGLTLEDLLSGNPATTASTVVARRQALHDAGGFDASLRRAEDQELLFRIAATTRWRVAGIDDVLVDYRTSSRGLAADLGAFAADFERFVERARRVAPAAVECIEGSARGRIHRWLARRALRLGMERSTARRHIASALRHAPSLAWREPRQTLGTLLAALLPRHPAIDRYVG